MPERATRRTFLKKSTAAGLALGLAGPTPAGAADMKHFICVTCGMQYAPSEKEPEGCPICLDERQYVGPGGQKWTTLDEYKKTHKNVFAEEEPDLYSVHPQPKAGIGQRAFVVRTKDGNVLWDCVPPLDGATVTVVKKFGGLAAVAVSHPHYYTTMVEWSHAFGKVPDYIHKLDAKWVMRPDEVVNIWDGETKPLLGGLTLIKTGGHFDGFQVLHWPAGAGGKGVLLCGDQPYVCQDRKWVSFMWSYPNLIPLGPTGIRQVAKSLQPFAFDRLYGAFPEQVVKTDAKGAVERSADRYLKKIGG
ncbi:twin-arginine translocation signal domain-containing protein [Frigoriglobus tundricola]|uniref:YmaE n=1 Tax=Frigoriglobus tundricola TaxID=2774151 RepID=A0A6M5Z567_9BACT|nr:twin-arginine translocation signal domain-containing protein [Frigoriglobus tundricola]QJX00594.1 YmaE [Frigoriglobus tundricola]